MNRYYDYFCGAYLIPVEKFDDLKTEVFEFLKTHKEHCLAYHEVGDDADEKFWCVVPQENL